MTEQKNSPSDGRISAPSPSTMESSAGRGWRAPVGESEQWRIVLMEFVHLLGLFLLHARQAKGVRATAVLFDQMMRHLEILELMSGHDGCLILRKAAGDESEKGRAPDYHIEFGDLSIQGLGDLAASGGPMAHKRLAQLDSGLSQSFECLERHRIDGLYIELPAGSAERTDHLRLALNIAARFQLAVQHTNSITFHYFGRALTIPLIRDYRGEPDSNLTIMAGLNALTTVNAQSLIKQAEAYGQMYAVPEAEGETAALKLSSYNQIFQVRSLRAQIIRPPVELNNLEALEIMDRGKPAKRITSSGAGQAPESSPVEMVEDGEGNELMMPIVMRSHPHKEKLEIGREFFAKWIDIDDPKYQDALNAVLSDSYEKLGAFEIGSRLAVVSTLIYAMDKTCQDPMVIDRLLFVLQDRLMQASDGVLGNIHVQNQGLKLFSRGRTVIAGLMHARLIDLVVLVKDKVVTRHKINIVRNLGFDFKKVDMNAVTRGFDLTGNSAHQMMDVLKNCFYAGGGFNREVFEAHIDVMEPHADTLFEMLWCFLKLTPKRKDRLALVNAIPVLMARLDDPGRALRFMLDELCQDIYQVDFTNRNALVLANILLRTENKELYIDLQRTPEHVLDQVMESDTLTKRYVVWRLNTDHIRIIAKFETIHLALLKAIQAASDSQAEPLETQFLFSLEREVLIFMSLAGSMTARNFLRQALVRYGNRQAEIYQTEYAGHYLSQFVNHLRIVVRGLARVGESEDVESLEALKGHADAICELAIHPAQALAVRRTLKWVDESVKTIQKRIL